MYEDEHGRGFGADPARYRLATYGTLAPGRPNAHQLAALDGRWSEGQVHGRLVEAGWGAGLGFPALILDPAGSAIPVHIFESGTFPIIGRVSTRSRDPGIDGS